MDVFIGEQNIAYVGSVRLCVRATLAEAVSATLEAVREDRNSQANWTITRVVIAEGAEFEYLVWKAIWFPPCGHPEACIQYGPVGEGGWIDLARAVREYPGGSAASKTREASHVR